MRVDFTKAFNKQFEKLPRKRQEHARKSSALFLKNISHPTLRNHALKGEWLGYRSISAGGDLRLHFKTIDENKVLFVAVGTYAQLYK